MVMIRIILLVLCFIANVHCALAMNHYVDFGNEANQNPNDVYIGSLDVGTGECHVIRQGDVAIIVDAGNRSTTPANIVVNRIQQMLSHNGGMANLNAIFTTHPHADHYNLVNDILVAGNAYIANAGQNIHQIAEQLTQATLNQQQQNIVGNIQQLVANNQGNQFAQNVLNAALQANALNIIYAVGYEIARQLLMNNGFAIYLGGQFDFYQNSIPFYNIVNFMQGAGNPWRYLNDGNYQISGMNILAQSIPAGVIRNSQDINRFGSVISIRCNNRRVTFLGDMDFETYKSVSQINIGQHNIGANQNHVALAGAINDADILTTPHHASMNNFESYVYKSLLLHNANRVFLASTNSNGQTVQIYGNILLDIAGFTALNFQHLLSVRTRVHDIIDGYQEQVIQQNTAIPLFSTENAPRGFIWTRIEPNGNVSIHDGNVWRQVL